MRQSYVAPFLVGDFFSVELSMKFLAFFYAVSANLPQFFPRGRRFAAGRESPIEVKHDGSDRSAGWRGVQRFDNVPPSFREIVQNAKRV